MVDLIPQLVRSTRIAYIDEPDSDVLMLTGTIKKCTGGDKHYSPEELFRIARIIDAMKIDS